MANQYVVWADPSVVSRILNYIRNIMPKYYDSFDKIGSNDTIVKIYKSKFGKRKYNKDHKVDGVWVLGMVERTSERRMILIAVDNRTKETLTENVSKI